MLVLSRKRNEQIRIGDVVITVVDVGGNKVRIGIDAPPEVTIERPEKAEQRELPAAKD